MSERSDEGLGHPGAEAGDLSASTLEAVRHGRRGVRAALGELERAVAAPSAGRSKEWILTVTERMQALREAFSHHVVVTEGRDGLFEEIMGHAPRLARKVDRLRDDHVGISEELDAAAATEAGSDPDGQVDAVREAALSVMGHVVRHRHAGSSLVYEAYFVDIEAAD